MSRAGIVPAHELPAPLIAVQDVTFEVIAALAIERRLVTGAWTADDRETVLELSVYAAMKHCGCACCRTHLPVLLQAEQWDRTERTSYTAGHEQTVEAADHLRGLNGAIEAVGARLDVARLAGRS